MSAKPALQRLEAVRRARQPFHDLGKRLLAADLDRHLPEKGPVVEIGMGDGQLRELLPETVRPRLVHTEPDAAVSRAYRRRHPDTVVLQAAAEHLPFDAASVAAVLGLCVLDVVPDGPGVVRELARVVKPGGLVLHWLDMTTTLEAVVQFSWSAGQVPFPNLFGDPSAQDWPEDLWLIPRAQLALVVHSLQQQGSPAASPLAQYLATFSAAPVTVGAATRELVQLQESAALRSALRGAFRMAFERAPPELRELLGKITGQPLSTAGYFAATLRRWFTEADGFRIEQCGVERAWGTVPRLPSEPVYRSCLVGEQRSLTRLPDVQLCPDARSDPEHETLLELGIFSFVATRLGG